MQIAPSVFVRETSPDDFKTEPAGIYEKKLLYVRASVWCVRGVIIP